MTKKGLAIFLAMMMVLTVWMIIPQDDEANAQEASTTMDLPIWTHEYPFLGTDAIDGIAVGEVYTDKPGEETVITSRDGATYVLYYENDQWIKEKIWESPGQQLTPAIGDLRSDIDGNEILVVGLSSGSEDVDPGNGTATVLYRDGTSWTAERAYTDSKLIHGCAIGDLDPDNPGVEAVITTFNYTALMIWWDTDHWNSSFMYKDSHNVRKAVIADLTDEHEGNEVVCVSKSGNATVSWIEDGNWTNILVYSGDPLARVAVGDVDPSPGLEIYLGRDVPEGGIIGVRWDGSEWINRTIFVDTAKNRGVWAGDVDPSVPGQELYSFGYSRRLVQLTGSFAAGFNSKDLFLDSARGHEIRIGNLRDDIPGLEIGIVGYSNNLTMVYPSEWVHDLPFIGDAAVDGIAIGEVYEDKEGFETIITARDGGTYLIYMEDGQWIKENLWQAQGQQLTPAIGDLIPERPGNEILIVGLSSGDEDNDPGDGTATVLYREGNTWQNMRAFTDTKLIHGCDIGDIDPNHPGVEAVLTTFNYTAHVMWWDGTQFQTELMFRDSHNVRKAVIADLIDTHEGNEVVCVSKSGNATIAYGTVGNWTWERIYTGIPLARVAVGNVDPDPGLEIYLGGDVADGRVIGLKWSGTEWVDTVVFTDEAKNRGVWTGDVDPDVPGQELYTFGYSNKLTQVVDPFGTGRSSKTLFEDTARGHEIRVGDLIPTKEGNEIAIVGYSNNLTIVHLKDEGEPVVPTMTGDDSISLDAGTSASLDLSVVGDSYMTLQATTFDGADVSLNMESIFIKGSPKLTVMADNGNQDIEETVTLTLHYPGGSLTKDIAVSITGDKTVPSASSAISEGEEITWEETVTVTLSEAVTEDSFNDAVVAGDISLVIGEEEQDVDFTLSDDGMMISFVMTEEIKRGDASLTISGLRDISGNEMETYTLDFSIEKEEEEEEDYTWLIILLVVVFIILVVIIGIALASKGKKDDEELKDIPEDIPAE